MKALFVFSLTLAFSMITLPVAAQEDFSDVEFEVTQVSGNVWALISGRGGNIGVSIGDDGTFIVDDQFAPLTDKIVAAIAGLTDKPVSFVANSHFHYDHTDGNENFGSQGALIVAHHNARMRMATHQVLSGSNRPQPPYQEVGLPKITFDESMQFHYNGNTIDLLHLGPAHTDGDAVYYFRDANVVHTGDMFVRYGLPYIDVGNGGSHDGMIDACWELAGIIDEETIIIPGHGQLSTRTDLLEYRAMLMTIRDRVKDLIAEGRTIDQIIASNPARGFAEPGPGTEEWLRVAHEQWK